MSGYTKGPWRVTEDRGGYGKRGSHYAITSDEWYLAFTIGDVGKLADHEEANARLMAAAPELLDALKSLVARFGEDTDPSLRVARAAIAKAEVSQ